VKVAAAVVITALAWCVIAEGRTQTLWGGIFAIPVSLWVGIRLGLGAVAPRPTRVPGFLMFFVGRSLVAGARVAWLALRPRPNLDPALIAYPLRLPVGAKEVFMATVSLLPGTLAARVTGDTLHVHTLNAAAARSDVVETERRVAWLFGIPVAELA